VVGDGTWLTVGELAKLLGVDDNTARKYVDDGDADKPVKHFRDRRIHKHSAERLRQELQGS
jgi:predicted site-specific integrase-resolvase